jgi:hypothetical protein
MSPHNEAIIPILVATINNGLLDDPDKIDQKLEVIIDAYTKIKELINPKESH